MADDERWMDDLAQKEAARHADDAQEQERQQRETHETKAAIDRELPALKSQLCEAAQRETERFKETMGFGDEPACLCNQAGTIEVTWSRNQGARLTIQVEMSSRSLKVEVTHRDVPTTIALPSAAVRVSDGHLNVYLDGTIVSPEDAISGILRPFFEFVVNEA